MNTTTRSTSTYSLGGLRFGIVMRLVILWLVIISSLVSIYLVIYSNMQSQSLSLEKLPDPIKILLEGSTSRTFSLRSSSSFELNPLPSNASARNNSPKVLNNSSSPLNKSIPINRRRQILPGKTKFAYVTLLHGIDESFAYRGYLYNCIIMKESLKRLGSTMDFIVMVGFLHPDQMMRDNGASELIRQDLKLLEYYGIILYYLPRLHSPNDLRDYFRRRERQDYSSPGEAFSPAALEILIRRFSKQKANFLEMALLKITPWSFVEYQKVQYMDGDILPFVNMDCLFALDRNTFNTGSASPINSGWYLAITNQSDYDRLKLLTIPRFSKKWDEVNGWGQKLPIDIFYRGQNRVVKKWEFNGASLDQGLCTHYFALNEGRVQLLDVRSVIQYNPSYQKEIIEDGLQKVVDSICSLPGKRGISPMDFFYHFTGRNKPWLQNLARPKDKSIKLWREILNSLNLSVNSSTLNGNLLKPPLGFFHPNK